MHVVKIHDKRLTRESEYQGRDYHDEFMYAGTFYQRQAKDKGDGKEPAIYWSMKLGKGDDATYLNLFMTKPTPYDPKLEEQIKKKQDFILKNGEDLLGRFWGQYSGVMNGQLYLAENDEVSAVLAVGIGLSMRLYIDVTCEEFYVSGRDILKAEESDADVSAAEKKDRGHAQRADNKAEAADTASAMMMSADDDEEIPF